MPINKKFQAHVTSTAFHINLSKNMVDYLFYHREFDDLRQATSRDRAIHALNLPMNVTVATAHSLVARGLMEMVTCDEPPYLKPVQVLRISEVGRKMCELLEMAGFGIESAEDKITRADIRSAKEPQPRIPRRSFSEFTEASRIRGWNVSIRTITTSSAAGLGLSGYGAIC